MSATVAQAKEIVGLYAGLHVRVQMDGYYIDGKLRPGTGGGFFRVFGRPSNWREKYAEPFKDDAEAFAKALRWAARPEMHYIRFDLADCIARAEPDAAGRLADAESGR